MIAVGPGATDKDGKLVTPSVKAGDRVLLPGWGGNAIKVGEDVRGGLLPTYVCLADKLCGCRSSTSSATRRFLRRSRSEMPSEMRL